MTREILDLPATDPVAAFSAFSTDPLAVLFDSAVQGDSRARYTYIAADPVDAVVVSDGADPFPRLRRLLAARSQPALAGLPPFQGGVAGWLGYGLGRHFERVPAQVQAPPAFPDAVLGVFDAVAAFDHHSGTAWVIGTSKAARHLRDRLLAALPPPAMEWRLGVAAGPDRDRGDYQAAIARVVEYIHAGDVFQVNLAQRFTATLPAGLDPFMVYRRLRARAPAPFAAYMVGGGMVVASVSPERFLSADPQGWVESRPIKGTRPRGVTATEDARLAAELAGSEKDRAENLMILDLMRNDLSRVCRIGSVAAPQRMALETFSAVHHLVSAVTGQMRPGLGPVDLLAATFPPGSITGAPKPRAMEIIAELETAPRGPYCGAFGWFGDDGALDLAVAIRTMAIRDGMAVIHAGGGITAESDPVTEYDETLVKAAPLLAALAGGQP